VREGYREEEGGRRALKGDLDPPPKGNQGPEKGRDSPRLPQIHRHAKSRTPLLYTQTYMVLQRSQWANWGCLLSLFKLLSAPLGRGQGRKGS
jgi:hypothetical protein